MPAIQILTESTGGHAVHCRRFPAKTCSFGKGGVNVNDSDIVSEVVKFNAQNGEGYYREVTYKDGGFRQFDIDTGELIGSSYESDQADLPTLE